MRKIVVLILLSCLLNKGNSQHIQLLDQKSTIVNGDTVLVPFHPGPDHGWTEIYTDIYVKNNTSSSLYIHVKKREPHLRSDEYHSFCFAGVCVDSSVFVSPYPAMINAGKTDSSFSGHFRFDDLLHPPGECVVSYTFYNNTDTTDSAIVYVNYNTRMFAGLQNISGFENIFIYPNPIIEGFYLHSALRQELYVKSKLIIQNVVGEIVLCQTFPYLAEGTKYNIENISPGVYYYTFTIDENNTGWKKLIVTGR